MKKVLVTGAGGQLGKSIREIVEQNPIPGYNFIFAGRADLDIANPNLVETFFFSNSIDVCINCAAYTAVDLAETEADEAFSINADGVKHLAKECEAQHAVFIHVSTDYVFDGQGTQAYLESDSTNPLGVYGKSKLEGERLATDYCSKTYIVRTSWVYSDHGKNFYTTMKRLLSEKEEIKVVNDQHGRPTHARALGQILLDIMQKEIPFGIYHYAEKAPTTWYAFAQEIGKEIGSSCLVHPISTSEYPTPAKRPAYSVLDTSKIEAALNRLDA